MALNFNEVLHPRTGLLVIRQTGLGPTLKTLAGSAIMGMIIFFIVSTNISSLMFEEGLNWAARLVPTTFLLLIILFGLALTVSGILQLIQPTEYQFDSHKKAYLKNGHIKATVDQLNGAGFYRRRNRDHSSYYQLFLDFKKGEQIKLMKTNSPERAEEIANEINKILDLPGTENTFVNKYQKFFLVIWLVVFFTIIIGGAVDYFWPGLLTNKSPKINEKYIPYSGREREIKNRKLKGVLFELKLNGKWGWFESGDENRDGKYVGEIALGKPNGFGIYEYSNGNRYEGEWRGGRRHGQGTYAWSDGGKYVGEWKQGKFHGQGTRTFGKGEWEEDKYEGEWKNGKRDGHGTYTWSDGGKYVGEWKSGKKHGQGTHTWSVGSKYVGKFKNGNFWNGTEYDKDGNIFGKWVNGVFQK